MNTHGKWITALLVLSFILVSCKKDEPAPTFSSVATFTPLPTTVPTDAPTDTPPSPTAVEVASADEQCTALVQEAYDKTNAACEGTGRDQACYGNNTITAEPTSLQFNETGDIVNVEELQSLRLSSLDTASNVWGISLMRLQVAPEDTENTIELLLFGNVELNNAGTTDTGLQAFTFQSGVDDAPCETAPDSGLMVQTPQGVGEITLLVNEVVIDLGSTVYLQSQPNAEMVVNTLEGQATVTSNGQTVVVPAGTRTRIPVDSTGIAAGAPSLAEPYEAARVQPLPVVLLDEQITIAPPVTSNNINPPSPTDTPTATNTSNTNVGEVREPTPISGSLPASQRDTYTISGQVGETYYLQVHLIENECCASILISDPAGNGVYSSGFSQTEDYHEVTIDTAGDYEIAIEPIGDATLGDYEGLIGVVPLAQTFPTSLGDTIQPDGSGKGQIEDIGSRDIYTFEVEAGQRVYFQTLSEVGVSLIQWSLDDPEGINVFTSVGYGEPWNEEHLLEKAGTYTLTIDGVNLFIGDYSLKLWDVPPPDETSLEFNQPIDGEIEVIGAQDVYTFTAQVGQTLFFKQTVGDCCPFLWTLNAEDGSSIIYTAAIDNTEVTLETGGTFNLTVDGTDMNAGAYSFIVNTVTEPDTFEIPLDMIVEPDIPSRGAGSIETFGGQDVYTFSVPAGQTIYITMMEENMDTDGLFYLSLYDEDNTTVFQDQYFSVGMVEEYTLERGGTYHLKVSGYADTTGTYRLRISSDPLGVPPIPAGAIRQWASEATASTEYTDTRWNAMQASGEPNTFQCGDIDTAWASRSSTGQDTLELRYEQPLVPIRIDIYQTYNPGSITQVQLLTVSGETVTLPNSSDPPNNTTCPGGFVVDVDDFSEPVNGIIIHLDQTISGSWNEIDAVALIGREP